MKKIVLLLFVPVLSQAQAYKTAIRHDELVAELTELGTTIPTGSGVGITQVEAGFGTATAILPDSTNAEFSGKIITDQDGGSTNSSHATTVGKNLYGNTTSVSPGITQVDVYEANNWLNILGWYGDTPPVESNPIQNHSWVGFDTTSNATLRMDYAVGRDEFLPIVGLNNSNYGDPNTISDIPSVYGSIYNGITVGVNDGTHRYGTTSYDGVGRTKPEIVAPSSFTSFATPMVASVAAFLIDAAGSDTAAQKSVTLKAVILAAADKSVSPNWDQTPTRPIDEQYGAGKLDIYESYFIQQGGQQNAGSTIGLRGWNLATITSSSTHSYTITVPAGYGLRNLSALVTWNRTVSRQRQGQNFNYIPSLANLALNLKNNNNGSSLQNSNSSVDNIEHIWRDASNALTAGSYTLEVTSNTSAEYAIAWRSELYQDFATWATNAFDAGVPEADRDATDDPDSDSVKNLLEFALGGDPSAKDSSILPTQTRVEDGGSSYLELSFTRPKDLSGITYTVQTADELVTWPTDSSGVNANPVIVDNGDGTETLTYRRTQAVSPNSRAFMRLKVSIP
ncbi:MAG: hypothetical protein GWO81_07380 [Verrucomicrobia bacterium]|nr:hypothetical protein [Verrucomicrobiota bacterium]